MTIHSGSAILLDRLPVVLRQAAITVLAACLMEGPLPTAAQSPIQEPQTQHKQISLHDALNSTLQHHPTLEVQHWEVESARGARQQASGAFDTSIESSFARQNQQTPVTALSSQVPDGSTSTTVPTSDTTYRFGISKLFRSGISVSSFTNVDRSTNTLLGPLPFNTSQVGMQAIFPLLRGRGEKAVAATELAGKVEVDSREYDLEHTEEQLLTNTAVAYWNLVAAKRQLQVATGSEQRGKILLDTVQALIEADQVPRADIYQVKANLADRVANRITFEQAVMQAREDLGLSMGLSPDEILHIGDPADGFPLLDESIAATGAEDLTPYYVQLAMSNRPDLMAAQKREVEARMLLLGAQNATKAQLNFQFTTGYTQLRANDSAAGFFQSLFTNTHGPDLSSGIVYQFSHSNNVAKGLLLQAQSKMREAELQTTDLRRQVTAAVSTATFNVRTSIMRVKSAEEAVEAFQKALEGEREKFRLGQASLTEVLTVEDRLTQTLTSKVNAEQTYALALAALWLATGTLAGGTSPGNIDSDFFQTLPSFHHGQPQVNP